MLVREAHEGGLMGHFGVVKTLDVLHEHFYWPKMKRDVQRICEQCIACRKAKILTALMIITSEFSSFNV
jgi:hypothetical protein